jgi:branched-chain amino acid transport system permease protein
VNARLPAALPYVGFLGGLLLVPALFTRVPLYTMGNGVHMAVVAIAALGLVPLTGYAMQVSIGQAAFYGTGAYASAVLTVRHGLPSPIAAAAGMALAAAAAYLLGLLLFRVEGHYLALATLGLGLVLTIVARQVEVTGGAEGLPGVPALAPFGVELVGDLAFYYLAAGVLFVAVVAVGALLRSRVGRSLVAVGDSPAAAAASGIDIAARKRLAFVVSAVLAAAAGALYAHWVGYVDPSALDLPLSLQLLIVATVGGLRTVWGAPVGAFLVVSLLQISQETLPRVSERVGGQTETIAYGLVLVLVLVLVLLLLPDGVAGAALAHLRRRSPGPWRRRSWGAVGGASSPHMDRALAAPARLEIDGLTVAYGGIRAVDDLTLRHDRGGVVGLIGPNGAGKTTVLNVLAGSVRPTAGQVRLDGGRIGGQRPDRVARAGVARTFQHLEPFASLSVLDNVLVALEARRDGPARPRQTAEALLADVGLTDRLDAPVAALPQGLQRRVEVARALAARLLLLLLDEPLAGLSRVEADELAAVVRRVADAGVTVLLVEHDVAAIMATSDRVVVLDHGRLLADGPPATVEVDGQVRAAYLGMEPQR